ncbi:MAG: hypothetical protein KKF44_11720 [Nanoarchaeota archaeon]|nr:hypothetical protein [Nanoarchaeota archaeon]
MICQKTASGYDFTGIGMDQCGKCLEQNDPLNANLPNCLNTLSSFSDEACQKAANIARTEGTTTASCVAECTCTEEGLPPGALPGDGYPVGPISIGPPNCLKPSEPICCKCAASESQGDCDILDGYDSVECLTDTTKCPTENAELSGECHIGEETGTCCHLKAGAGLTGKSCGKGSRTYNDYGTELPFTESCVSGLTCPCRGAITGQYGDELGQQGDITWLYPKDCGSGSVCCRCPGGSAGGSGAGGAAGGTGQQMCATDKTKTCESWTKREGISITCVPSCTCSGMYEDTGIMLGLLGDKCEFPDCPLSAPYCCKCAAGNEPAGAVDPGTTPAPIPTPGTESDCPACIPEVDASLCPGDTRHEGCSVGFVCCYDGAAPTPTPTPTPDSPLCATLSTNEYSYQCLSALQCSNKGASCEGLTFESFGCSDVCCRCPTGAAPTPTPSTDTPCTNIVQGYYCRLPQDCEADPKCSGTIGEKGDHGCDSYKICCTCSNNPPIPTPSTAPA